MNEKTPHKAYKLRLMSDQEMKAKSEINFSIKDLLSKSFCLDSEMFGAVNSPCTICRQISKCPGHSGIIELPIPIPRAICYNSLKSLIPIICPKCSNIPLDNRLKKLILTLPKSERIRQIKAEIEKTLKNNKTLLCPVCHENTALISIESSEPTLRFILGKEIQLHPNVLFIILSNFTEIDLVGFSENWHPRNFFTTLIPIVPNKLRLKLYDVVSSITSYYKAIVEEILPELNKIIKLFNSDNWTEIPKGELGTKFNNYYDKLNSYYLLISDTTNEKTLETSLRFINKRDRKHIDSSISLIGRIKGKKHSYFTKGIIDSRHDCSARTVLNGAPDSKVITVNVPKYIAKRLTTKYPVYAQNLKTMRAIVASMSDPTNYNNTERPTVLRVFRGGKVRKITISNATTEAALLMPGNKIELSLINGDFVMQSRYPSVREESWTSLQIKKDDNSVITIPLAICEMKMADFDGDEAQIYVSSNECYSIEALLLHSIYRQLIAYKDGFQAIAFKADTAEGIGKIKPGKNIIIQGSRAVFPPLSVTAEIEKILPENMNYESEKIEIKNGKILRSNFWDKEFYKYIYILYGPEITCEIIDKIVQLSYDINKNDGVTLGFNIRIYNDENRRKIEKIKSELYSELCDHERTNEENKDLNQVLRSQKIQGEIKKILAEDIIGTPIETYAKSKLEEYFSMIIEIGQILDYDGNRFINKISEGTRTISAFPRFSIDPKAYGYASRGYANDPDVIMHFYDAKCQRFQMYSKGTRLVAKQGYAQKRFCMLFGIAVADFNGNITDGHRLLQLGYGPCGMDPRYHVKIPFNHNHVPECAGIYAELMEWRNRYAKHTHETATNIIGDTWVSGFDWEQYIKSNLKRRTGDDGEQKNGKTKTEYKSATKPEIINLFIKNLRELYSPPGSRVGNFWSDDNYALINLKYHEYYFKNIFTEYELDEEHFDEMLEIFANILINGGESVGYKAALSASEPLTQAVLHSIHGHASSVNENKLIKTAGTNRFEELIGGAQFNNTIISLALYDDSRENSTKYAQQLETFFLSDILVSLAININKQVDSKIREIYPEIPYKDLLIKEYNISMIWNISTIANYNIHPCDVINRILENYEEVFFCVGYVVNSSEIKIFAYFKPDITLERVFMLSEEWQQNTRATVIHGKYLKNCYVSENKSNPGHYIIQGNEVTEGNNALENLLYLPEINPAFCRSTNINTMVNLCGCMEGQAQLNAALFDAVSNLSATSGVLMSHYNLISSLCFLNGKLGGASRYNIIGDKYIEQLQKLNYEDIKKAIVDAINTNEPESARSYVSAQTFGEYPRNGVGVSDVYLYEC